MIWKLNHGKRERERDSFAVNEKVYVMSRKNPWIKPPFVKK